MAIPNQTPYNIFTANGISTVFPYEFYLLNAFDLTVSINGAELTSGFTISGIGNVDGGEVTFLTPPANGSVILLERVVPTYRLTEYQDNGDLLAETVNKDFDRLWMAIQQVFIYLGLALTRPLLGGPFNAHGYRIENLGDPINPQDAVTKKWFGEQNAFSLARTIRVPVGEVLTQLPQAHVRRGKLQAYDVATGDSLLIYPGTVDQQTALNLQSFDGLKYIGACPDIATLRLIVGVDNQRIFVTEYLRDGVHGGGTFKWSPDTVTTDDGGSFIRTDPSGGWRRFGKTDLSVYDFGGVKDGDSTVAIQNYVNWAVAQRGSQNIGNKNTRLVSGVNVDLSGSWGITRKISVPACNRVRFSNGVIFAMPTFDSSTKSMFSFAEQNDFLSYEGIVWDGVHLSANHNAPICLEVNKYNRFTITGGALFTGFSASGLVLGDAQNGVLHEGHECITESMYFAEYDYDDTRRGSESGIAIEVYTNDNQLGGFTISSAKQAVLCPVPGNVFHNFHVWGVTDKDWAIEIVGGSTTGTKLTNFKLGASRIVILSPAGINISDWNGEHVTTDFTNRFEYIWLKPGATNQNIRAVSVVNGKVQVAQPSGGGVATYETWTVTAKPVPAGGFERVRTINCGSGYTTASVVVNDPGGVGSGAAFEVRIINGFISRVRVIESGSGYSTATKITISGDGTGATVASTITQITKSFGDTIDNVHVNGNGIVGGGVESLNISPLTQKGFSSGFLSSVSNFPISFDKKMLIPNRARVMSSQFIADAAASTKSPYITPVIDFTNRVVNVGTFTNQSNTTSSTTSGVMIVTLDCSSSLTG